MAKIARINRLPEREKEQFYFLLIPPSLFTRFQLDPHSGRNARGERCITVDAPTGGSEASVRVMRRPDDPDPSFFIEVSDCRDLIQLYWDFILINNPEAPRFNTDVTPEGGDRWLNWRSRNLPEEEKALAAGLAPGQVRRGLSLTGELNRCLDRFSEAAGFFTIALEALFYHNAIYYERHGFRYFQGEPVMRRIHEGFLPGGPLRRLLNGPPFRRPDFADAIRGRSWAIHDGILEEAGDGFEPWCPPKMYRMVGKHMEINTAPEIVF